MADDEQSSREDRAESKGGGGGGGGGGVVAYRPAGAGGFFTIYKRGQGYWTRMGTAIGAALIALLFAEFIYADSMSENLPPLGIDENRYSQRAEVEPSLALLCRMCDVLQEAPD